MLEVLKFPDPRLRKKSVPVEQVTGEHRQFIDNMLETMYGFKGIGLAAPQVGRLERIVVIDTRPREEARYEEIEFTDLEKKVPQPLVLINPEIKQKDGKVTYDEGCLSVPTYYETVERAKHIVLTYLDKEGKKIELEVDGLLSICVQHEIDHLDGKLFIDRLSPVKSNRIRSKIKKFGYPDPDEDEDEEDHKEL